MIKIDYDQYARALIGSGVLALIFVEISGNGISLLGILLILAGIALLLMRKYFK